MKRRNPLKIDPTRTGWIIQRYRAEMRRRFALLARFVTDLVNTQDAFGLRPLQVFNSRYSFQTTAEQVRSFSREVAGQIERLILGAEERLWWADFVTQGFKQGAGRVFDDVKKRAGHYLKQTTDFFNGTREEFFRQAFARPETVEKLQLLAGRNFTELKGITDQMANVMSRTLTEGLSRGENPRVLAKQLRDQISEVSDRRAETLARTEIIRAHAEGQLRAFESLGIEEVGIAVEWSTADDSRVCVLCAALGGIVIKISEAKGLLPRHPNCRCAFIPANVGESTDEQLKSKTRIQGAIAKSIGFERKRGTFEEKRAKSKWVGADLHVSKKRPTTKER